MVDRRNVDTIGCHRLAEQCIDQWTPGFKRQGVANLPATMHADGVSSDKTPRLWFQAPKFQDSDRDQYLKVQDQDTEFQDQGQDTELQDRNQNFKVQDQDQDFKLQEPH